MLFLSDGWMPTRAAGVTSGVALRGVLHSKLRSGPGQQAKVSDLIYDELAGKSQTSYIHHASLRFRDSPMNRYFFHTSGSHGLNGSVTADTGF